MLPASPTCLVSHVDPASSSCETPCCTMFFLSAHCCNPCLQSLSCCSCLLAGPQEHSLVLLCCFVPAVVCSHPAPLHCSPAVRLHPVQCYCCADCIYHGIYCSWSKGPTSALTITWDIQQGRRAGSKEAQERAIQAGEPVQIAMDSSTAWHLMPKFAAKDFATRDGCCFWKWHISPTR